MKFSRQLLVALVSLTVVCVGGVCVVSERKLERQAHREFVTHFATVGKTLAAAAANAETTIDAFAATALLAIRASETPGAPLAWEAYERLAAAVGVANLSVYDLYGRYVSLRPDAAPADMQLFDLCPAYSTLATRSAAPWTTPFLRSFHNNPAKFAMMPSADGQRILSIKVQSSEIGRLLQEAVATDAHIRTMEITTPSGVVLASACNVRPLSPHDADPVNFDFVIPSTVGRCCQCVQQGLVTDDANYGYRLKLSVSQHDLLTTLRTGRIELALLFCAIVASAVLIALFLARQLSHQLEIIDTVAADLVVAHDFTVPNQRTELSRLSATLDAMAARLRCQSELQAEAAKSRDLARMAQRVAHDIRSPVAALQLASEAATALPEEERELLHAAVQRIRTIANDLLTSYSNRPTPPAEPTCVDRVVRGIIAEKRSLYAHKALQWPVHVAPALANQQICLPGVELGRILSNLLDNAVEALEPAGTGTIGVTAQLHANACVLVVSDTGHGIAAADIPRVLGGGVSLNKKHGNGVGLHSAREMVESCGGTLSLTSIVGMGTKISMDLPLIARR